MAGRGTGNSRNGYSGKTVLTEGMIGSPGQEDSEANAGPDTGTVSLAG